MTKGSSDKSKTKPKRPMAKNRESANQSIQPKVGAGRLAVEASDQGVVARFEAFQKNPPATIEIPQARTLAELTLGTIFGARASQ